MRLKERNKVLSLEKQVEDKDKEIDLLNHDLLIWESECHRLIKKYKTASFNRSEELLCK